MLYLSIYIYSNAIVNVTVISVGNGVSLEGLCQ